MRRSSGTMKESRRASRGPTSISSSTVHNSEFPLHDLNVAIKIWISNTEQRKATLAITWNVASSNVLWANWGDGFALQPWG